MEEGASMRRSQTCSFASALFEFPAPKTMFQFGLKESQAQPPAGKTSSLKFWYEQFSTPWF